MKFRRALPLFFASIGVFLFSAGPSEAQTPARGPGRGGSSQVVEADLAQLMKGILFPNSNVIFFAQSGDPAKVEPAKDPSVATDPLADTYGKWQAVENSALALAEAANLLTIPGRKCSNGLPVPMNNPDWAKFVQGLRDAGMKAYKAAQSKDMDKILDAADTMTSACSNCHEKYREKPTLADRCK
ncbi:MAG TPA: hypothetical protein VGL82_22530 [Bryobacteraceae bacterium]|jgi:hypothetical protein